MFGKLKSTELCSGCKASIGGYRDSAAIIEHVEALPVKKHFTMPKILPSLSIKKKTGIVAVLAVVGLGLAFFKSIMITCLLGVLLLAGAVGGVYGILVGPYKLGNLICDWLDWTMPKNEGPFTWMFGVAPVGLPYLIYWLGRLAMLLIEGMK